MISSILNLIPPGLFRYIPIITLGLGLYGAVLVVRAASGSPKTRSWPGTTLLAVSIGVDLVLFLIFQFAVKFGASQNAKLLYLVENVAQLAALGLGIYGAVLVTRATLEEPRSRSWIGMAAVAAAILIDLVFLMIQLFLEYTRFHY